MLSFIAISYAAGGTAVRAWRLVHSAIGTAPAITPGAVVHGALGAALPGARPLFIAVLVLVGREPVAQPSSGNPADLDTRLMRCRGNVWSS